MSVFTLWELQQLIRRCEELPPGSVEPIDVQKFASLGKAHLQFMEDSQKLTDVCEALGMTPPERPCPNFGSGLIGGSNFEAEARANWNGKVRTAARTGLRGKA